MNARWRITRASAALWPSVLWIRAVHAGKMRDEIIPGSDVAAYCYYFFFFFSPSSCYHISVVPNILLADYTFIICYIFKTSHWSQFDDGWYCMHHWRNMKRKKLIEKKEKLIYSSCRHRSREFEEQFNIYNNWICSPSPTCKKKKNPIIKCLLHLAGFGVNKEQRVQAGGCVLGAEARNDCVAEMCISASSADKINATWAQLLNV